MRYEIQTLGLGGILDQAILLLKNHFKTLFGIVAVLYIPYGVFQYLVCMIQAANPESEKLFGLSQSWILLTALLFLIILPLTNAAMILAISDLYLGKPITAMGAIKRAVKFIIPLVFIGILWWLGIVLGFILLIIPGVYLWFRWYFWTFVVVLDGKGVKSFGRSMKLMKGNVRTAFLLSLIIGIISLAISLSANILPGLLLTSIFSAVTSAIVMLFGAAAKVVFYFSARCQHEQFDLEMLAETVGREIPAPEPALVP